MAWKDTLFAWKRSLSSGGRFLLGLAISLFILVSCSLTSPSEQVLVSQADEFQPGDIQDEIVYLPLILNGTSSDEFALELDLMPVYNVVGSGITEGQARDLADILGLEESPVDANGAIYYMDLDRFQYIPIQIIGEGEPDEEGLATLLEAVDIETLSEITVLGDEQAYLLVEDILNQAGLLEFGGTSQVEASVVLDHSLLDRVLPDGTLLSTTPLDTQVNFDFNLENIPLVGLGAQVKLVVNGEGEVTQIIYAMRDIERGEMVVIIPEDQGDQLCRQAYLGAGNDPGPDMNLDVSSVLVYYAPPLEIGSVAKIFPHFLCSGTATIVDEVEGGESVYALQGLYIPAIDDAPQVTIHLETAGDLVYAQADVSGGTPPYRYMWSSTTTSLDPDLALGSSEIEYQVVGREPADSETVSLIVIDANGLIAWSDASAPVAGTALPQVNLHVRAAPVAAESDIEAGIEWVANTYTDKLLFPAWSAKSFLQRTNQEGYIQEEFNWGEKDAWERDFRDVTKWWIGVPTGDDVKWVDNVDIVFFGGHGTPDGMRFSVSKDETKFNRSNALWGDRDLDWIAFDACDLLRGGTMGTYRGEAVRRWNSAFTGLHHFMGFATLKMGSADLGEYFARYMLTSPPLRIRKAWARAASERVEPYVTKKTWWGGTENERTYYAIMFPIRHDWVSPISDYFHKKGQISPDIEPSEIREFWRITGGT